MFLGRRRRQELEGKCDFRKFIFIIMAFQILKIYKNEFYFMIRVNDLNCIGNFQEIQF